MGQGGGSGQGFNVDPAAIRESLKHLYLLRQDMQKDSSLVEDLANVERPGDSPETQKFHQAAVGSMTALQQQFHDYQTLVGNTIAQLEATLTQYQQVDQQVSGGFTNKGA
jgi:hypothetical protein